MLCQHFDWDLTHQVLFLYILPSNHMNLRDHSWRCTYFGAELTFVAANFLQKYPWCQKILFQFHLFVNWTISAFVSSRLARRSPANSLFPLGEAKFFWSGPQCLGLGKSQNNTEISIKVARVSRLFFRFLWLWYYKVITACCVIISVSNTRCFNNQCIKINVWSCMM